MFHGAHSRWGPVELQKMEERQAVIVFPLRMVCNRYVRLMNHRRIPGYSRQFAVPDRSFGRIGDS
jgi:hypothetical protein